MSQWVQYTTGAYSRLEAGNVRHNGVSVALTRFWPTPFEALAGKGGPRAVQRVPGYSRAV